MPLMADKLISNDGRAYDSEKAYRLYSTPFRSGRILLLWVYSVGQTENNSWEYTGKGQLSDAVMLSNWSAAARAFSIAGTITS